MIEVNEEENLRLVDFDGKDNMPTVAVTIEELDRRCEEPELGDIGFRFVKKSWKCHNEWKTYWHIIKK